MSPLWNEESNLVGLAGTIEHQTYLPVAWMLVDDSSTDGTRSVATALAERIRFARVVIHERDTGNREYGSDFGAPAAAFNAGVQALYKLGVHFDVVMKIDADLRLNKSLVAAMANAFASDQRLGVASASMFIFDGKRTRRDRPGGTHTHGMTKAYRRKFYEEIGGLPTVLGWDTIDEISAELRGYNIATVSDAKAVQVRPMGATTGLRRGRIRAGRASYLIGYPAWAILARASRRIFERPRVVGSFWMLYGYSAAADFAAKPS